MCVSVYLHGVSVSEYVWLSVSMFLSMCVCLCVLSVCVCLCASNIYVCLNVPVYM